MFPKKLMFKGNIGRGCIATVFLPISLAVVHAQHSHINAGAYSVGPGSQLYFVNGDEFSSESGFVLNLGLMSNGPFTGLYRGSITFTALAATPETGGPAFGHAALGSYLQLKVDSVSGPDGGILGFWLEDSQAGTAEKLFEIPVGTTSGQVMFNLSESHASPGSDPYGHVHGRRFTLNKPGLYTIGFQIVDTSQNGPNNGPLHTPSEIFSFHMQAGVTIAKVKREGSDVAITFATAAGSTYQVEAADSLLSTGTVWTPVGEALSGNGHLQTATDSPGGKSVRFYRLKVTTP